MFDESAGIVSADAAAGKRSIDVVYDVGPELKKFAADGGADRPVAFPPQTSATLLEPQLPQTTTAAVQHADVAPVEAATGDQGSSKANNTAEVTKDPANRAREIRLEQNRKAARESRRRKKVMIEELQRSVIFFSRANTTLKQQNEELARVLLKAQSKIKALDEGKDIESLVFSEEIKAPPAPSMESQTTTVVEAAPEPEVAPQESVPAPSQQEQQAKAQAVATQAMLERQGFPAAAARMAAQTMNAGSMSVPAMQPGATMQAMANFQAACAQAMQAAIHGMQSVPGLNVSQMQALPISGTSIQQAYTDQMTALAMQQAAAAHMGAHHFMLAAPLLAGNAMWAAAAAAQPAPAAQTVDTTTSDKSVGEVVTKDSSNT